MKIKKTFTVILLLLCHLVYTDAEVQAGDQTEKVVIYYFQDKNKTTDFRYYSYVIPDSIASDIKKTNKFQVQTLPVTLEYIDKKSSKEVMTTHISMLANRGKEFSAKYIISGSFYIKNKRIIIQTQVFNVKTQEITDVLESSSELGALLFIVIERITKRINTELYKFLEEQLKNEDKEEIQEARYDSPFIPLYNTINGLSFGMNYGAVDFYGKWGDVYSDTELISSYLFYDLIKLDSFRKIAFLKDTAVSLNFDYFHTDSGHSNTVLSVWGMTFNLIYLYRISSLTNIAFSMGAGAIKSQLVYYEGSGDDGGPFGPNEQKKWSTDPYLNLSIFARFHVNPIEINTGFSLRRIFYNDEAMNLSVLFFGIGYRL